MLVSAAISRGAPHELLIGWHSGLYELVVSYQLLYELEAVLLREKFRSKLSFSEVLEYVVWLRERATLVEEQRIERVTGDPDDDYLIALARESGADFLVSGDKRHVLGLRLQAPPKIASPREFVQVFETPPGA